MSPCKYHVSNSDEDTGRVVPEFLGINAADCIPDADAPQYPTLIKIKTLFKLVLQHDINLDDQYKKKAIDHLQTVLRIVSRGPSVDPQTLRRLEECDVPDISEPLRADSKPRSPRSPQYNASTMSIAPRFPASGISGAYPHPYADAMGGVPQHLSEYLPNDFVPLVGQDLTSDWDYLTIGGLGKRYHGPKKATNIAEI